MKKLFRRRKQQLVEQVQAAQKSGNKQIKRRPYIIPFAGLLLGLVIVAAMLAGHKGIDKPSDAHVVFLSDKNDRRVVDTRAKTVGEMISKLNLDLQPEDVVEPGINTTIAEDNFRVNIYRARPVTVIDNGTKTVTLTAQKSARVVAQNAGLKLNAEDVASFDQGSLEENVIGEKVVVNRAVPIKMNLYGANLTTYTLAKTVGDLLSEKQIKLQQGETVQPDIKTAITPNMDVFILRKDAKLINAEEVVPAPEQVVNDASLSFGTNVLRQAGAPGKKNVTYLIQTDTTGKEIGRTVLHEVIIQAPVAQITAHGISISINGDRTSVMAAAGIASSDYGYVNYIVSRESNWHVTAENPSGAYGLCQALPGSKMSTAGSDWATNPVTQLRWCSGYAQRFGGWAGAYSYWQAHGYW